MVYVRDLQAPALRRRHHDLIKARLCDDADGRSRDGPRLRKISKKRVWPSVRMNDTMTFDTKTKK